MATNREVATEITESAVDFHEELHGQYPEDRDLGVDRWYSRQDKLSDYDPDELLAIDRELSEIPEVKAYAHEPVTIEAVKNMMTVAAEFNPEVNNWNEAAEIYSELTGDLQKYINKYAETLRHFAVIHTQAFHLEREQYQARMANSDQARHSAHNTLMSQLNAVSRFLTQKIPKYGGRDFNQSAWDQQLSKRWFSIDQLKDRDYLADWAIRTDIAEKAQVVRQAIRQTIEKKSTATN